MIKKHQLTDCIESGTVFFEMNSRHCFPCHWNSFWTYSRNISQWIIFLKKIMPEWIQNKVFFLFSFRFGYLLLSPQNTKLFLFVAMTNINGSFRSFRIHFNLKLGTFMQFENPTKVVFPTFCSWTLKSRSFRNEQVFFCFRFVLVALFCPRKHEAVFC